MLCCLNRQHNSKQPNWQPLGQGRRLESGPKVGSCLQSLTCRHGPACYPPQPTPFHLSPCPILTPTALPKPLCQPSKARLIFGPPGPGYGAQWPAGLSAQKMVQTCICDPIGMAEEMCAGQVTIWIVLWITCSLCELSLLCIGFDESVNLWSIWFLKSQGSRQNKTRTWTPILIMLFPLYMPTSEMQCMIYWTWTQVTCLQNPAPLNCKAYCASLDKLLSVWSVFEGWWGIQTWCSHFCCSELLSLGRTNEIKDIPQSSLWVFLERGM